jgi:Epoxide hydrolase N terminus
MPHEPAPSQDAEAQPFPLAPAAIHVPDDVLADLQRRLQLTRWPDVGNQDWYYGVNRAYLRSSSTTGAPVTTDARPRPRSTPTSGSRACPCTSCASPGSAPTRSR